LTYFERFRFGFHHVCDFGNGGRFHKTICPVERRQKGLDLRKQSFIITARLDSKRSTLLRLSPQSRIENFSYFWPVSVRHLL
jgi:hypothetical protein